MEGLLFGLPIIFLIAVGVYLEFSLFSGFAWFIARHGKIKPHKSSRKLRKHILETEDWAEEHGMTFSGIFDVLGTTYAAWFLPDRSLFLFQGIMKKRQQQFELETRFAGEITLNTSNIFDEGANPAPPGTYKQVFTQATLDELWKHHCEAERFLVEQCGVVFVPRLPDLDWPESDDVNSKQNVDLAEQAETLDRTNANPFAVLYDDNETAASQWDSDSFSQTDIRFIQRNLQRSWRAQCRYMIGLFQWRWLLWGYYVFIRYRLVRNRTVEQLIAKGWDKRPEELPQDYRKWYR